MAETRYQDLSAGDRRDALEVAERSSHKADLLEKDVWVVAALAALFDAPFAGHLTLKCGTSLSKVWRKIRRFSEDIDTTCDIRAFAPDLVSGAGAEALPPTRSRENRWTRAIRARLAEWVRDQASLIVEEALARTGFLAVVRVGGDRLHVGYEPLFEETGFVRREVVVQFGTRSTGEPYKVLAIACDAAAYLPGLAFPEARRGERMFRHWDDLARLGEAGITASALADRALALSVARHKGMFFFENDATGERIDYEAAVTGDLHLVPVGTADEVLTDDYPRMLADGMLLDEQEPFDALMERCAVIEARANELKP